MKINIPNPYNINIKVSGSFLNWSEPIKVFKTLNFLFFIN